MISAIVKVDHIFPNIPPILVPVLPTIAVSLAAYVIAKYLEVPLRKIDSEFAPKNSVQPQNN